MKFKYLTSEGIQYIGNKESKFRGVLLIGRVHLPCEMKRMKSRLHLNGVTCSLVLFLPITVLKACQQRNNLPRNLAMKRNGQDEHETCSCPSRESHFSQS